MEQGVIRSKYPSHTFWGYRPDEGGGQGHLLLGFGLVVGGEEGLKFLNQKPGEGQSL